MQVNLNPANTYSATNNAFNVIATVLAGTFAIVSAIQLYFLFIQKKDMLAGMGFLTSGDPIDKALFFIAATVVCGAIALKRGLLIIAVVFGVAWLLGNYGKSFQIEGQQNFSLDTLPPVNYAGFGGSTSSADQQQPAFDENSARTWMNKMREAGYTRCSNRPLAPAERQWCVNINPKTSKPNLFNDFHNQGNCTTFYVHVPQGQDCPK